MQTQKYSLRFQYVYVASGWSRGKTGVFLFFKLVETPSGFAICSQTLMSAQVGAVRKWFRNGGWGLSDARQTLNSSVADFSGHIPAEHIGTPQYVWKWEAITLTCAQSLEILC